MRAKKTLSQALEFHFHVENESVENILAEGGKVVVLEFLQPFENIESVAAALSAFVKDGSDLLFQILFRRLEYFFRHRARVRKLRHRLREGGILYARRGFDVNFQLRHRIVVHGKFNRGLVAFDVQRIRTPFALHGVRSQPEFVLHHAESERFLGIELFHGDAVVKERGFAGAEHLFGLLPARSALAAALLAAAAAEPPLGRLSFPAFRRKRLAPPRSFFLPGRLRCFRRFFRPKIPVVFRALKWAYSCSCCC